MLRTLTSDEIALVSGGNQTDRCGYSNSFDDWGSFDSWIQGIDFDLRSLDDFSISINIFDGDGFDVSAYSNWGISEGDISFDGAGITITIEF